MRSDVRLGITTKNLRSVCGEDVAHSFHQGAVYSQSKATIGTMGTAILRRSDLQVPFSDSVPVVVGMAFLAGPMQLSASAGGDAAAADHPWWGRHQYNPPLEPMVGVSHTEAMMREGVLCTFPLGGLVTCSHRPNRPLTPAACEGLKTACGAQS
jgi:hypothetical protein